MTMKAITEMITAAAEAVPLSPPFIEQGPKVQTKLCCPFHCRMVG